jgi:hypothetical protein
MHDGSLLYLATVVRFSRDLKNEEHQASDDPANARTKNHKPSQ